MAPHLEMPQPSSPEHLQQDRRTSSDHQEREPWMLRVLEHICTWLSGPYGLDDTDVVFDPMFYGPFHLPWRER